MLRQWLLQRSKSAPDADDGPGPQPQLLLAIVSFETGGTGKHRSQLARHTTDGERSMPDRVERSPYWQWKEGAFEGWWWWLWGGGWFVIGKLRVINRCSYHEPRVDCDIRTKGQDDWDVL